MRSAILAVHDEVADLEWVCVDATVVRAHRQAAGAGRDKGARMHCFAKLEPFRRVATRYDKFPTDVLGFVATPAIVIRLESLNPRHSLVGATPEQRRRRRRHAAVTVSTNRMPWVTGS